jgi:hypothetical protein
MPTEDTCSQQGPEGYWCTQLPGHSGDHFARGPSDHIYETWPNTPVASRFAADPQPGDWNDPTNRAIHAIVLRLATHGVDLAIIEDAINAGNRCALTREYTP